jgi:hypothetical protein
LRGALVGALAAAGHEVLHVPRPGARIASPTAKDRETDTGDALAIADVVRAKARRARAGA